MDVTYCKLEIFIPESHLEILAEALRAMDAGHIGKYDGCFSYSPVTGCWRPLPGAEPYLGREGELSREPELKVEVTCRLDRAAEALLSSPAGVAFTKSWSPQMTAKNTPSQ